MSNRKKAAGDRGRHIPQHRKEPSWTVGDLPGLPSGLGAKIIVAGVAGATLAIPATSAFASPSSVPAGSTPAMVTISKAADRAGVYRVHAGTTTRPTAQPDVQVPAAYRAAQQHRAAHQHSAAGERRETNQHGRSGQTRHSPPQPTAAPSGSSAASGSASQTMPLPPQTVAASNPAVSAAQGAGSGLLLEPDGTFAVLAPSASNMLSVPAGSLIINSDGTFLSPSVGTYATSYGLITVAQAPGSGTGSAGTATSGTVPVNPGGPFQPTPQLPSQGGTTTVSQPNDATVPLPVLPPNAGGGQTAVGGAVVPTLAPLQVATPAPGSDPCGLSAVAICSFNPALPGTGTAIPPEAFGVPTATTAPATPAPATAGSATGAPTTGATAPATGTTAPSAPATTATAPATTAPATTAPSTAAPTAPSTAAPTAPSTAAPTAPSTPSAPAFVCAGHHCAGHRHRASDHPHSGQGTGTGTQACGAGGQRHGWSDRGRQRDGHAQREREPGLPGVGNRGQPAPVIAYRQPSPADSADLPADRSERDSGRSGTPGPDPEPEPAGAAFGAPARADTGSRPEHGHRHRVPGRTGREPRQPRPVGVAR